ncbi:ATP-dependent helicase HrpA [Nitrosomonas sp. Nm51]|uniref:ATP-dependent RNA helicase HrpA n=1 Tax=Nitrosomonas sp. Nm51 TaxID=133720 RepID=UPI0008BF7C7C|nr:ATP-dependent RNA helicase HrpA [Nitrosomonas sp. Nm51]SER16039.1 ATP-dependent helicase HrpA [Nitrosomonas sp. Nm51]
MEHDLPDQLANRLARLPQPIYPENLPVVAKREAIKQAIAENQVVIVCGETGSGKTTQLPKICLELERGVGGIIGHTQPRRIAARSVAARIATELDSPLGKAVGYKVRFSDKIGADSYIKLMTDGILLAETQSDPKLLAYDTLIIDEAHERSLNIDFLLGYITRLLPSRSDLKLIVTSATIDAERFSRHFDHAPVIEVSGRAYPVDIRYRPIMPDDEDIDMQQKILSAVDEIMQSSSSGDILVFLPGEREIRETAELLRKHHFDRKPSGVPNVEILPLFARLSYSEQERVFRLGQVRRIVLATNVAETSLTVPGIRYVVDTGWARINRYSYRNKVEQLQTEKISRASADQRAGRCGRIASGICYRLYSEDDYQARPEFTEPEILRSSLASVILRMKSLKIGDVENFPFLEAPSARMIADGYQLLAEVGGVDENKRLTRLGWQLAKFPIDPRIARMVLAAKHENCLHEVLIIASALSLQDPRDRPFEHQDAADQAHRRFLDERSDFMSYLKLWEFFDKLLKHKKSNRKLVAQCQAHFLSCRRLREWREIHNQLNVLVKEFGFRPNEIPATYDEIHRALLAGLLGNIGFKTEKEGEYLGARGIRFSIFPGSALKKGKAKAKWVVCAELVETSRLYGRCAARIDPGWIEKIAGNLCRHDYFDPHWQKKRAEVIAYERVTLYGLPVVTKRPVHYGRINPEESRGLFIRGALIAGEYHTRAPFFAHNRRLVKEIEELEHKTRRQDVLVDDETIFAFYDTRIPQRIYNGAGFEHWRKQAERENSTLLYLDRELLTRHSGDAVEVQFPERLALSGGIGLALSYRFDPGHVLDGVTAPIPLPVLNRLDAEQFDYLVPGLIREKVTWYLKALPKQIRRLLVPIPESVTEFLQWQSVSAQGASLRDALTKFILRKTTLTIPVDTWEDKAMPSHLLMNFKIIDEAGEELAMGRDLEALQEQFSGAAQSTFRQLSLDDEKTDIERDDIKCWDFDGLPEEITFTRNGRKLTGYPALVDEKDHAAIRLFDTRAAADQAMRKGICCLMRLAFRERMKQLDKSMPGFRQAALQLTTCINPGELKQDLLDTITDRAFAGEEPLPRTQQAFNEQIPIAKKRLPRVIENYTRVLSEIAEAYHALMQCRSSIKRISPRIKTELDEQLNHLMYPGFIGGTPWERLKHFPRYLKAMCVRLEKSSGNLPRDEQHAAEIKALWSRYEQYREKHQRLNIDDPNLTEFRWQLEELRVSLFAQELKTPKPVSVKRLERLWEKVRK